MDIRRISLVSALFVSLMLKSVLRSQFQSLQSGQIELVQQKNWQSRCEFHLTAGIVILYIGMTYKRRVAGEGGALCTGRCSRLLWLRLFRICKNAYRMGQAQYAEGANSVKGRLKSLTRRFVLRGLAEINRGKLSNVNQVQKYMGQQWPVDILSTAAQDRDINTRFQLQKLTL